MCLQSDKKQQFDESAGDFEESLADLKACVENLTSRFGSIGALLAELEESLSAPQNVQLTEADSGKTIKQIIDELKSCVDAYSRTNSDMVSFPSVSSWFWSVSSSVWILSDSCFRHTSGQARSPM